MTDTADTQSASPVERLVRRLSGELRKWWSFDNYQQHTHSWHDREDFIEKRLADLVSTSVGEDLRKGDRDLDAIRAAMEQSIETYDQYSTVADKEDEARLDGMRSMLPLFDVNRRMCDSR